MKADKNFKMDKQTKTILALGKFRSPQDRNSFKRSMIDAKLCSEEAARRPVGGAAKDKGIDI